MSINKNFVIKNGLEVDTDLIVANAVTNKIGIGTTAALYTLHVNGGIGATTFVVSGISTLGITSTTNLTSQQLNVSGISTLGITSTTNLTSQQLNVSGISTLGITSTTNLTSQQLNVSGISTLGVTSTTNLTSQQLNVSGISTLGITSTTNLTSQQLNISGISTLGITSTTNLTSQQLNVSGSVGIGTTNPTQALDVNGSALIRTDLFVGSDSPLVIANGNTHEIYKPNGQIRLRGGGSQSSRNNILLTNNSGLIIDGGSDETAGVELKGGGGPVKVTQGNLLVGTSSSTGTTSQLLQVDSGAYVSGNLGIGTTNPTSKLHVVGDVKVTGLNVSGLNVSGISTLGITSTTNLTSQQLNVSGISTLGITSTTNLTSQQLNVSGISTLGITSTTNLTSQQLNVSGISTLGITSTTNLTSQQLNVSGISTLGITSTTNLTSQQLNVSGISTLGITSTTNLTSQQLNVSGISTLGITSTTNLTSQQLNVSGISTLGITSTTNLTSQQLNVSGSVGIGTTNPTSALTVTNNALISGIITASSFVGDGSDLRNLSGTHIVSYASHSETSNSTLSIAGISTYNQVGILTGSLAVDLFDYFGNSVATSSDGKTIVVGAPVDESGATTDTGVVYVFDRVGNSFNQVGILTGSFLNAGDKFGDSVATSSDGKTIVVGAPVDEIGANPGTGIVYVFDRVGNSFNQVGILTGSLAGDTNDSFGDSVATSADGKTIVVGAPEDEIGANPGTGIVYVFDRVGNSFNQVGILTGSLAGDANDNFGYSVATSADGKTIVVGAPDDEIGATGFTGVVYVFDRVGNSFNQVGILTGSLAVNAFDNFGYSVATSADGKTIVVGDFDDEIGANTSTGVVYVFDRVGNSFNQVGILTGSLAGDTNDLFGYSVATSADGKTIVVGAPQDEIGATTSTGVVYVFNRQGNSFNQVGILTGSGAGDPTDLFGYSVATSSDGKTIIVGATLDESGTVYVFDQTRDTYVYSGPTGNVGIGTTNPTSKLHIIGDARVGINTSQGVILTSANGTKYRLIVSDAGVLSTILVP